MRTLTLLAALALPLAPLAAQTPKADPDKAVAGGGIVATGWTARADGDAALTNVKLVAEGKNVHATLGPATIFYQTHNVTKPFHTLATFTQTKAPTHPEGYGLFFGGKDLAAAGQQYIYFLVRGDGKFLIKRRTGATTADVTKGWTESAAVQKADANGKATNKLEIENKMQPDTVTFRINGQDVYSAPESELDRMGAVGLRINHNLDVVVEGFDVHQ